MKRFLFDTNSLTSAVLSAAKNRRDLCILEDVLEEWAGTEEEYRRIRSSGISVLHMEGKHLKKLKLIMDQHGSNLDLIRLHTGKGTADVAMLAFAVCEMETGGMFPDTWIFVTDDKALKDAAASHNINSISVASVIS